MTLIREITPSGMSIHIYVYHHYNADPSWNTNLWFNKYMRETLCQSLTVVFFYPFNTENRKENRMCDIPSREGLRFVIADFISPILNRRFKTHVWHILYKQRNSLPQKRNTPMLGSSCRSGLKKSDETKVNVPTWECL